MAKDEVIEKIKALLESHDPLTEEFHVTHLLVQARKVLDHEKHGGGNGFPLLRFYCDWAVHTEKDRITPAMKAIMEGIFSSVRNQVTKGPSLRGGNSVTQFAYMEQLRDEVRQFAARYGLGPSWAEAGWLPFVRLLVRILANQPVVKPTDDIELFSFIPAADDCVGCLVKFTAPMNGHDGRSYDHYTYFNAY